MNPLFRPRQVWLSLTLSALTLTAAHAADAGFAYVSNQDGGVSVINLETLTIEKQLDIGARGPRGIGISRDGKTLITANKDDGNLSLVDLATGTVRHVRIGKNPEFVRVLGNKAHVTYEPSSKGGPPPKPGQKPQEDDDDDKEPARIAEVDLTAGKVLREIKSGPETEGIEFTPDGKQMIVSNEADNTLTVHSLKNGKLLKTIHTHQHGDRPRGVKVSPDGKTVVASLEFGNKLLILDARYKTLKTVDTGNTPYGLSFDPSGQWLYVATAREKALQVFDAQTFTKRKDIPTGDRCWHFTFTPDHRQLLVACGKSNEIVVIDAEQQAVVKRIANPGTPWGIVTWPKAMGSLDKP